MSLVRTGEKGFTLLEIITVFLLIAIVSVVVISRSVSTSEVNLASQVEVIKSHIRYAQARAMNTNKVWGVSLSSGSYMVFIQDGGKQNKVVLGQDAATISLPSGMTVSAGEVSFDQWGQPYNNDTATGTSSTINITVNYSGQSSSSSILQNTGFIP